MFTRYYKFLTILFLICPIGTVNAVQGSFSDTAATRQKVSIFMDSIMTKYSVPGSITGIWPGDTAAILLTKGVSDIQSKHPIKQTDQARIGSITKTFVVSLLLELVDERKISLEDTLKRFFPHFPGAEKILIRQLCNHTSGIHDIVEDTLNLNNFVIKPKYRWTKQELIDSITHTKLDFEPGSSFSYSNTGYLILGLIIEKTTKTSIEKEITKRFVKKFGLRHTRFPLDSTFSASYSNGYYYHTSAKQLSDITFTSPSFVWTAGAMVSNLKDLKTWVRIFCRGTFLNATLHNEQMTFAQGWNEYSRYGLGIMKLGNRFIGHSGGIYGYNTGMFFDPSTKTTVIIILNNCNQVDGHITEVMKGISRILYGE